MRNGVHKPWLACQALTGCSAANTKGLRFAQSTSSLFSQNFHPLPLDLVALFMPLNVASNVVRTGKCAPIFPSIGMNGNPIVFFTDNLIPIS